MLGAQADLSFPNLLAGTQTIAVAGIDIANYEQQVLFSGTLRGRLGYAFGPLLVYGTGGYALAQDEITRTQVAGMAMGGTATPETEEARRSFRSGWVAGAGIETKVGGNWSANLEFLFTDLGSHSVTFPNGAQTFNSDITFQNVRVGLNYRLPGIGDDASLVRPKFAAPSPSDWSVHAQTTYLIQMDPDFRSPYVGPHSLIPGQQRETWDATFYLGLRLWQGAELWIDPEIDQGFGLSDTFGVAGFPSGEAYKLGEAVPYARVPRYFVRDTINFGGASEKIDGAANKLSGSQTADRLVLTLGKFAITDVFDTNQYAHDPRSDWMNWALVDTGTFDYAGDAWGYTYGAAVEWYRGDWILRAGLFDLSTVPGSTDLDTTFKQFQSVVELERRYKAWDQPGKVAVTGYLSSGRMGAYADAIALSEVTGQPADIAAVRRYRTRPGIGINMQQQVNDEVKLFARAGWCDGEVEPFDFTDIDRTVAVGFLSSGKAWGRSDDVVGVAGIVNGISNIHEAFFNAGGLGLLIGDGQLPHPGPEEIIEAYYNFPIESVRTTLDYQFIKNPAFNEDRGPVSVLGGRLHAQF